MRSPSSCCNNIVKLSDLVGKPTEFRQYKNYAPTIGVKWICPSCNTEFFAKWKQIDKFWDNVDDANQLQLLSNNGETYLNQYCGKYVTKENGKNKDTGAFSILLELYDVLGEYSKKCESEEKTQFILYE